MAERIGKRKDQRPVIIEVMALKAANEGVHISRFGGLYLASEIPVRFIAGPPLPKSALRERETAAQEKKDVTEVIRDFTPGTFFLDLKNDPDKSRRIKGRKKRGWKEEVRGMRQKGLRSGFYFPDQIISVKFFCCYLDKLVPDMLFRVCHYLYIVISEPLYGLILF